MIKTIRNKRRKIPFSFNKINKKTNYNTLSPLKFRYYSKLLNQNESNKDSNIVETKPLITTNYYKDPFFLNENNLRTQLQILRAINKETLNTNNFDTIESNKDTLPSLYDLKASTFNYFKSDPVESDDFYYKSVFKMKPLFKKIRPVVDNKLNMRYAENEEQYKKIIEKEQKYLLSQGKKVKNRNISEHINIKMNDIKNRIRFMKGVIDYTFPGFVLTKIKAIDKKLKKDNNIKCKLNEYFSPVELRNMNKKKRSFDREKYFYECINVRNILQ